MFLESVACTAVLTIVVLNEAAPDAVVTVRVISLLSLLGVLLLVLLLLLCPESPSVVQTHHAFRALGTYGIVL